MIGQYEREKAERLIANATAFAKSDADLWALFGRRGLGARPDIVLPFIEHLRRRG